MCVIVSVFIALAVGIGYRLPASAEIIYENVFDTITLRVSGLVLRDVNRGLDAELTPRFGLSALGKWSPDGQHISYFSLNDAVLYGYLMDAQGRNSHPFDLKFNILDSGYIWSPDSHYILFSVTYEGMAQSVVLDVITGQAHLLPQVIGLGMWSPDSQNILYQAATEDGRSHLYGMNIKCLADAPTCLFRQLDLFDGQSTYDNFMWSPDGKAIVFSQQIQADIQVVVATLRCADLKNTCVNKTVVVGKGPLVRAPIWSPDSQQVAYVYDTQTLQTVDIKTGETRSFNTPDILPVLKDWSPDGRYIAYFSTRTGVFNVYLLDVIRGEVRPLFPNQPTTDLPEWRPIPR
jgi:Tol biopolymer transport system component